MSSARLSAGIAVIGAALLAAITIIMAQPASAGPIVLAPSGVTVSISTTNVSVKTGDAFTFTSTIANQGSQQTPRLVATMDLVSVGQDAYVDPEDWSPRRFLTIDPIPAGASQVQSWEIHAIQGGDYSIFVVVLPDSATATSGEAVAGSPALHLHVELQRNLNPAGVTPVAIAVPLVVGLALVTTRVAASRTRARRRGNGDSL